jgi:hypothetical protein
MEVVKTKEVGWWARVGRQKKAKGEVLLGVLGQTMGLV